MKTLKTFILLTFVVINITLQAQEPTTVKIGAQEWVTKNLDVVTFRNGDTIPEAKTNEEWEKAWKKGKPAWCYYENDSKNEKKYGKLYNWYAVNDARGLTPNGYHVPSKAEYDSLVSYLGGEEEIAGRKLKSTEDWLEYHSYDKDASFHIPKGTNESGFSGLPGGCRLNDGSFGYIGKFAGWWSATETDAGVAWYFNLVYSSFNVISFNYGEGFGFSVRCLRD